MSHGKLLLACVPAPTPLKPLHPHDCGHCIFLGQAEIEGQPTRDIYVCPKNANVPHDEVVLRYGEHGDYSSLPASVVAGLSGSMLWVLADIAYLGYTRGRYNSPADQPGFALQA